MSSGDLVHLESRAGSEVYGRADNEGWRLTLATPIASAIEPLLPTRQRYGRWIDRIGLVPAVVIGVVVSVAVVFATFQIPSLAAPLVPKSWERKFGDALVGDFGGKFCTGAGGQAALAKLSARLGASPEDYRIRVVNVPIVNAAALPGGNIVVFRQLITQAEGPDELAGVLAHEISHVEQRHVTQGLIRELGLGIFIAMLGGSTGSSADMLMSATYSRKAEAEADEGARTALERANISPLPTAGFFARLSRAEGKGTAATMVNYLDSHPLSADRRQRFERAALPGKAYTPALSREEWGALRNICGRPAK